MAPLLALACGSSLLGGCDDPNKEKPEDRGNVILQDSNNYSSQSALTIPSVETVSASDVEICWDQVLQDIQCHDIVGVDDIDQVAMVRFLNLTEDEVEARLTSGELSQSEIDGYLQFETPNTQPLCTPLSSLSLYGTPVDIGEEYVESDEQTYMLLFASGTTPGVGARTMMFVKPSAASTNTEVSAPDGCGMLDFSASLESLTPTEIPSDGPWIVDWRDITQDGQGNDVVFESIDSVLIGFYAGKTVAQLQEEILDLEIIADGLWDVELKGGRTADLAKAKSRVGGADFPGFQQDEEGVWLMGLMCSTCQNPAPVLLTVLEPGEGAS